MLQAWIRASPGASSGCGKLAKALKVRVGDLVE